MAHTHAARSLVSSHPGQHISTRDQYASSTPSFRRPAEHAVARSPTYPASVLRRHPISPSPGSFPGFASPGVRMDSNHYNARPATNNNIPPLLPTETLGSLQYTDGQGTPIKVEISGSIDKGFFQSDGEWTCYRRNYFACICSFSLNPHWASAPMQFTSADSNQALQVYSFAMCISAVVHDNDQHKIELIQHTPKRDKGPIMNPDRVPLAPKQASAPHHSLSLYNDASGMGAGRGFFADSFVNAHSAGQTVPTEHTFERIQFKQATQNNGKRRAAQQYYHIVVELWADVGSQSPDQFVKVALRKSAQMIVRGRSPGHYQNDRRGSHSSGPGGSTGAIGSYNGITNMTDFTSGNMLGGGGYAGGYDTRGNMYGVRHRELPAEMAVATEDDKAIHDTKGYQYYPGSIYAPTSDRVDMYQKRGETSVMGSQMGSSMDATAKPLNENDMSGLPRYYHAPMLANEKMRCGVFEGKGGSNGYYPTPMSPSGLDISMT